MLQLGFSLCCTVEALEGSLPSTADVHVQCQQATADKEQRAMSAEGQLVLPAVEGQRLEEEWPWRL